MLELADVIEVRKGTDPDPEKPTHTGTAILRRNCNEEQLALSFALITETRCVQPACRTLTTDRFGVLTGWSFRVIKQKLEHPVSVQRGLHDLVPEPSPDPAEESPTRSGRCAQTVAPAFPIAAWRCISDQQRIAQVGQGGRDEGGCQDPL